MKTTRMVTSFQRKFDMVLMAVRQRLLSLITDDGVLGDLDAHFVGDLQLDGVAVHFRDRAVDAAVGDHAIADFQRLEKFLQFLLPSLGGQQDDEIEDRENERDRYELNEWVHARALRRSHR